MCKVVNKKRLRKRLQAKDKGGVSVGLHWGIEDLWLAGFSCHSPAIWMSEYLAVDGDGAGAGAGAGDAVAPPAGDGHYWW